MEKSLNLAAYIISVVVLLLVVLMRSIHIDTGIDFSFLPPVYSFLNGLTAIVLLAAFLQIKQKRVDGHKKLMTTAMIMSLVFLLLYVVYHITTPETKFCGTGNIRIVYFILLISHVTLAAVSFPLVLFTFIRGYLMNVERHRSLARWVFPIWLYVCVTGPVCYIMLKPCYNLAS